jgi:adenosylcobinamide-GDP ribazoletransferase
MVRIGNIIIDFITTLKFFTSLPLPNHLRTDAGLEQMAVWTPWAGLVVGGFLVAAYYLTMWLFHPPLAAALVLCTWIIITGGLHLDGLGDCGDAFPAAVGTERRLEILRDPQLGAFGVIAIVCAVIVKFCAIYVIPATSWNWIFRSNIPFPFALLFAPVAARWLVLWAARAPLSRPAGLGMMYARGIQLRRILLAGILPLVLLAINGVPALAAVVIAAGGVWIITRIARARLGGVNGDVLGACIETSEIVILLVYAVRCIGG